MNPAINKQKKKKSQHFLGNQIENFPKKPNTIFWAFKIFSRNQDFLFKQTLKKLQLKLKTHSKIH